MLCPLNFCLDDVIISGDLTSLFRAKPQCVFVVRSIKSSVVSDTGRVFDVSNVCYYDGHSKIQRQFLEPNECQLYIIHIYYT